MMAMVFKIGGSVLSGIDELEIVAKKISQYIVNTRLDDAKSNTSSHIKSDLTKSDKNFDTNFDAKSNIRSGGNELPIIAISAFKNQTDKLLQMTKRLTKQLEQGEFHHDLVNQAVSFVSTTGEQVAAGLFALALQKYGVRAQAFAGWQLPIIVSKTVCNHEVRVEKQKIQAALAGGCVPVIAGFQGVDDDGRICDLGRGGTDLTAMCLAQVMDRDCVLLKKSSGVCSADPDLISHCFVWPKISYDNLIHLAQAGSRIVQKDAMQVAKKHGMRLKVTGLDFVCESGFQAQTEVVDHDVDFWSVFECNHKLRVVANKRFDELLEHGFKFVEDGAYYQFEKPYFDMQVEAHKVYAFCKERLGGVSL